MKNREKKENVFDEIDRDMEQVKIAMKLSRHERMFKKQIKMFKGFTIILFILSATLIYLGIFKGHNVSISLGIMSLFLTLYGSVFLKIISKSKTKKGDKR